MSQKFAFTTAAMSAALEETPVSYEDLADIEKEFDDVETEIIRQQIALTAPLYTRRSKTVSQIPNFWPLVLEQAPPDIDQYIQPSDSALLLSSLLSISVSHFEAESNTPGGDPRSVSVTWEFAPNDYFDDVKLVKKFWYRRSRDGWCGLVSEPVGIRWKEGRDLTGGLLGLVCKAWEAEKNTAAVDTKANGKAKKEGLTPEQKVLKRKIENTGMGGLSFFAWFGFIGRRVSEEESRDATRIEREKREKRKATKASTADSEGAELEAESEPEQDGDDDGEDIDMSLEIFPDGDDLAVSITEDLWPGAIKYFTQAQEQDAISDADFESDDEEGSAADEGSAGESEGDSEGRPKKKQRSS